LILRQQYSLLNNILLWLGNWSDLSCRGLMSLEMLLTKILRLLWLVFRFFSEVAQSPSDTNRKTPTFCWCSLELPPPPRHLTTTPSTTAPPHHQPPHHHTINHRTIT
jgi:hypothetical protein